MIINFECDSLEFTDIYGNKQRVNLSVKGINYFGNDKISYYGTDYQLHIINLRLLTNLTLFKGEEILKSYDIE